MLAPSVDGTFHDKTASCRGLRIAIQGGKNVSICSGDRGAVTKPIEVIGKPKSMPKFMGDNVLGYVVVPVTKVQTDRI